MKSNTTVVPIFSNSIHVEHYFFLYTSSNFIQDLTSRLLTLERFVRDLNNIDAIWIKPLKNSNYYELLFPEAIVLCSITDNCIELSGVYDKNLRNHAQFMKDGLVLGLNKDMVVIHHNSIQNKHIDRNIRHEEIHMMKSISDILKVFNYLADRKNQGLAEINHKHYEVEFENWLSLYDQSSLQNHETNIISQPRIRFDTVRHDAMLGPFTISFMIDSVLPIPVTNRHYFYVKTCNSEWVTGTLAERYVDDNKNVVVLKFERLYQVEDFNQDGHLYLFLTKPDIDKKMFEIYYNELSTDNILKRVLKKQLEDKKIDKIELPIDAKHQYNLDAEQVSVMEQALSADSIFYINGATTTGKTKVLNAIKSHYEERQKHVLFVSTVDFDMGNSDIYSVESLPKKLAALKKKTLSVLNQYELKVIEDKKHITMFASNALDLGLAEKEHANLTTYFKAFYSNLNTSYYAEMKKIHEEFLGNEILLNILYEKIGQAEIKINEFETMSQFGKFVMMPVLVSQQKAIERRYVRYNNLLTRQYEIKGTYNSYADKVSRMLSDDQLVAKKELWRLQNTQMLALQESLSQTIALKTIVSKGKSNRKFYSKDDILFLTNKLEALHQSIKDFKQLLLNHDDRLFYSIFIKEKTSLHVSMKLLHNHFSLFTNEFDVVIIDDAQSSTVLELFLAISLGKKVIVAGDRDQKAIVTDGKSYLNDIYNTEPQVFQMSSALALSMLLPNYAKTSLKHLYRIMPSLTILFNHVIFSEDSTNKNKTDLKKIDSLQSIFNPLMVLTTSQTKNRYESEITGYGIYNHIEATTIVNMVASILKKNESERYSRGKTNPDYVIDKIKPEDILITSFFEMQIEYIRTHLRYALPELSKETIDNMVRPIISCTGLEKKLVFLSLCVSSNSTDAYRDLTHLRNSSLWNIALSRAKNQLIIIGDIDYIKNATSDESQRSSIVNSQYKWTNYDVANVMKLMLKLAIQGDIQFISLESFSKQLLEVNGGFGYE